VSDTKYQYVSKVDWRNLKIKYSDVIKIVNLIGYQVKYNATQNDVVIGVVINDDIFVPVTIIDCALFGEQIPITYDPYKLY